MSLPVHPSHADDDASAPRVRRRVVFGVIALVLVLAGLHLLRQAVG